MFPLGVFISIFGLCFKYWVDKYVLLKRMTRPHLVSSDLNYKMMNQLEYVPLFIPIGNVIFYWLAQKTFHMSDQYPNIIALAISVINLILPSDTLN